MFWPHTQRSPGSITAAARCARRFRSTTGKAPHATNPRLLDSAALNVCGVAGGYPSRPRPYLPYIHTCPSTSTAPENMSPASTRAIACRPGTRSGTRTISCNSEGNSELPVSPCPPLPQNLSPLHQHQRVVVPTCHVLARTPAGKTAV